MQKIFPFIGFLLTLNIANAQKFEPSAPLDIPIVLSGTFAELRGNHFHGGIDIKTQGRSGLKVSASRWVREQNFCESLRVWKRALSTTPGRIYHSLRPFECVLP